jgi:predicted O-linked N-acetylglucosamine transferase (SPINDLY family)
LALAFERHRAGDLAGAARLYRQAISEGPSAVDGLNGLAAALLADGRLGFSERILARAGWIAPNDPRVIVNRALASIDQGKSSATQLARALALSPSLASVLDAIAGQASTATFWLGRAWASEPTSGRLLRLVTDLARRGERGIAQRRCRGAIAREPSRAPLLNGAASIAYEAGDVEAGRHGFLRALALDGLLAAAWSNLALASHDAGRLDAAVAAGRRAVVLEPSMADAHANLGNAALEAISPETATVSLARALYLQPDRLRNLSNLVMALSYVRSATARQAGLAIGWWRGHCTLPPRPSRAGPSSRLRVGYVSSFTLASTRHLGLSAIARHDPTAVEIFAYVQGRRGTSAPALGPALRQVRDISSLSDDATAELITDDGVDLLVDLCGHTPGNRLEVFARRPAPVQATWIESFFTTGLGAIDWFVTDGEHSPLGQTQPFVERRLDIGRPRFCYAPPDAPLGLGAPPSQRKGYVTFGCFNYPPKISDDAIALWSSILASVPGSRLRLKWWSMTVPHVAELMRERFARHGVGPGRLDLVGASSHLAMMEEYGEIDVALDPFPFTGGVTTCEALWMGVPVVSLAGESVIERQSACLLRAAGADDLVATDREAYRAIAARVAADVEGRAVRRLALRSRLRSSPLTDAAGMARALEAAYRHAMTAM